MATLKKLIMDLVPADGSAIGNQSLIEEISGKLGRKVRQKEYEAVRNELIERGKLVKGRGRGGSVKRNIPSRADFSQEDLEAAVEAEATKKRRKYRNAAVRW